MKMREQKTKLLRGYLAQYLISQQIDISKPFQCLNPAHEDSNPSMSFYEKGEIVKCFGCGAQYDLFDLIGIDYSLTSFPEQKAKAEALYSIGETITPAKRTKAQQTAHRKRKGGSESYTADQTKNFDRWRAAVNLTDYWQSRGINQNTIDKYWLGYNQHRDSVIIPCSKTYFIERRIRPGKDQPKYINQRGSRVQLFNEKALDQTEPVWITEGAIDALSILQVGYQATALNSANIINPLLEAIDQRLDSGKDLPTLILSLDNDRAGKENTVKLIKALKKRNHEHYVSFDGFGDSRDPNQMLKLHHGRLRALLSETTERARKLTFSLLGSREDTMQNSKDHKEPDHGIDYNRHTLGAYMAKLENREIPAVRIPTGFIELDSSLDGGFTPGLIILGAIPSAGKTTLALQIANQAAQAGHKVIFFSLEQSGVELASKSISSQTQNISQNQVIRMMADPKESSQTDKLIEGLGKVMNYADNMIILEGRKSTAEIKTRASEIISDLYRDQHPLIVIDYLQIVKPSNPYQDKRNSIDDICTDLKFLAVNSNCPVIAISSLNRDNYSRDISETAFKESGGIEYSSDVLIGLQYRILDETYQTTHQTSGGLGFKTARAITPAELEQEKSKPIREMQVKIIKNRAGKVGDRIDMDFDPRISRFTEEGKR